MGEVKPTPSPLSKSASLLMGFKEVLCQRMVNE